MNYETKQLKLDQLTVSNDIQSRVSKNESTIQEYTEILMDHTSELPPVVVFYDGNHYYLADGFHRYAAHSRAKKEEINCVIYPGSMMDAILFSAGANGKHGLNLTRADKERAIQMVLNINDGIKRSERDIARTCNLHHSFVNRFMKKVSQCDSPKISTPKIGSHSEKKTVDDQDELFMLNAQNYTHEEFLKDEEIRHQEDLIQEIQSLRERLALDSMEATDEEKILAKSMLDELKKENQTLSIDLAATKSSLHTRMNESNVMKDQIRRLQHVLKNKDKELEAKENEIKIKDAENALLRQQLGVRDNESLPF